MLAILLIALLISCAILPLVSSVTVSIPVSTNYGKVEGLKVSYPNASAPFKSISKFLGVPFAAPPIGKLRLKAPKPPKAWKPNVRPAKTHGNICLQPTAFGYLYKPYASNFSYSEDCLYLDVYTPDVSLHLPVMVYIHGGGFQIGCSIPFPSDILALQGVVVVVIQYRVGPFGFLTTGDSAAPGNFGMLDQVEALKWIKDNIGNFGGNSSKVTIFGESAGAACVSLHLLSPLSKGLFHGAIAESGVDLSPWVVQPTAYGIGFAKELAQKLECTKSEHNEMIACIRNKEGTDVQKASESITHRFFDLNMWSPVVDMNFLHDTPRNLRQKGHFSKVPFMISFNSHEGATTLGFMVNSSFGLMKSVDNGVNRDLFNAFLVKLAHGRNSGKPKEVVDLLTDALEFMYTPWPDNSDVYALRSQLVDLIGDYLYFAPSHEVAAIHSREAAVYMYEFAHRSKVVSYGSEWMGVVHADNIAYDFGIPFLSELPFNYDASDKNVSLFIMAMYVNFALYGDPTPEPVSGVTLKKFNSSHRVYLRVNVKPKMAASYHPRRMAFWNEYYPKLTQLTLNTKKDVLSGAVACVAMGTFLQRVHNILAMLLLQVFFLRNNRLIGR